MYDLTFVYNNQRNNNYIQTHFNTIFFHSTMKKQWRRRQETGKMQKAAYCNVKGRL